MLPAWRPSALTRCQHEERRLHGPILLNAGHSTADIAQAPGVSPSTVRNWRQALRQHGQDALKATRSTGRPRAPGEAQGERPRELLRQGPQAHGWNDGRWTTPRVREVIGREFGVWQHVDHLRKVLHALGFSPQKPTTRAMERDEQAVTTWVETVPPEVGKKVAEGRTLVFVDASGFSLKTAVVRTWAPRGQPPVVKSQCLVAQALHHRGDHDRRTVPAAHTRRLEW